MKDKYKNNVWKIYKKDEPRKKKLTRKERNERHQKVMTSSRESSSDDSTFQFEQDRERKREKRRNKKIKWKPTPEEEIRPQLEETHRVIDPYRDLTSRFHIKAKLDAVTKCRNWLDAQDFDIDDVDLQSSRDVTKKASRFKRVDSDSTNHRA